MASRGINKVILIGNLGQDPDIRHIPNGVSVANITLATSDNWIDKKTGEQKEKTEWHKVVIFGKLAEIAGEYLRKGSQIYIEGCLKTKKWQDNKGNDRYTTEVVVNLGGTMQMLGNRSSNSINNDQKGMWFSKNLKKNIVNNEKKEINILDKNLSKINENDLDYDDDDIPF